MSTNKEQTQDTSQEGQRQVGAKQYLFQNLKAINNSYSKLNNSLISSTRVLNDSKSQVNESISFKSKVARFKDDGQQTPGVGQYSLRQDDLISGQSFFNKKGFGNVFLSKSQRFSHGFINTGPGPGSYFNKDSQISNTLENAGAQSLQLNTTKDDSIIVKKQILKSQSQNLQHMFKRHDNASRSQKQVILPGPGQYENEPLKKGVSSSITAFKALNKRFLINPSITSTPSPWDYNLKHEIDKQLEDIQKQKKLLKKKNQGLSSFFKDKHQNPLQQNQLIESIKQEKNDYYKKIEQEYQQQLYPNSSKSVFSNEINLNEKVNKDFQKQSFFFMGGQDDNNRVKFFVSKDAHTMPGPTSYNQLKPDEYKREIKQFVSGAAFKSESSRNTYIDQNKLQLQVGPGSYKHNKENKKQYHFNINKVWI